MIKVKDGYAKLIGTTYSGSVSRVLLSNGGDHILGNSNGNIPLNNGTVNTNLNADMLDGLHIHEGRNNEVNKIVRTDISGYIQAGWINTTSGDIGAGAINKIYCSNDNYIRYKTPANFFPTLANSGNDISITVAGQNRKLTVAYASATSKINSRGNLTAYEEGSTTKGESGVNFYTVYNNGYPVTYGNLLHINGSGAGQLLAEWCGSSTLGHLYYRSKRDNSDNGWSAWGKVAFVTDNVASVTKLQTARSIWGHSFNGTADVNGTIYINNNNSSEGAIRLNNNINSNARISAIDSQVIFNTDAAIRFGGTSWDWNVWAGLKYTHSNKTIYLGIADGSIFNANSAQSGGSLRFPGISNVYATTFNGSLSGNASTATNADKIDGVHLSGIFTAFGNNAHNITATIGGVTKSFLVNWAADSDKLDGYHENSFLRYRGDTSTDQEATLWSQIGIKQYNNALPDNLTGVYNYGSVISLPGSSSRFEIYASHQSSNGNGLYYRSGWGSDKKTWLKFIDSSNIGSQSVNYANSAGNADKLDGIHANGLLTALSNTNNGISVTVGGTTKSVSNISVNYASSAGNADTATNAYHLRINSADTWSTWYWAGQSGQPSWLWGSNDGTNMYVWNPSNFRVAYATSAGNADTLDGEHAKDFVRAGFYENNDLNSLDTYSFIRSVNSQVSSTSPKGDIGWYNVIQLVHRNGDGDGPNYIGQIALGMTSNVNDIFFRCRRTDPWKTIIHSNNYTEFINNYYWANVKISTSSSTTTSPTVSNLTATSSIRMGNLYLQNTNEINSASGIHLNYQNSGNISLCYGGGNVGIGTISPSYKLDVNGNIHSSGTINCNALNVGSTLSIKDSVISCSASDISIESKESGHLLINSHEVLHYDSDFISMTNKTQFVHRLGLGASSPDPISNIHTTDDVTVYIGSLTESSSFEFRPAMDGQLLFLKVGKLYSNTYFWCTAKNCEVIKANNFSTYLARNGRKDCFGDGEARIFIYKQITERWYEFYCG